MSSPSKLCLLVRNYFRSSFESLKLESSKRQSPKEAVLALAREALELGIKTKEDIFDFSHRREEAKRPLEEKDIPAYLKALSDISIKYEKEVRSYPQQDKVSTHKFLEQFPEGKYSDGHHPSFYRANSRNKKGSVKPENLARLSVCLEPYRAVEIFEHTISELVIQPSPVIGAKLTDPRFINEINDSMLIYLSKDEEEAQKMAQKLVETFGSESFGSSAPREDKEMAPGIGYAEQSTTEKSHSMAIAAAIADAIQKHDAEASKPPEAQRSANESLQRKFEEEFLPEALKQYNIDALCELQRG